MKAEFGSSSGRLVHKWKVVFMGLIRESYFYIGRIGILTYLCCAGIQSASIRINFRTETLNFYWLNDILHRTIDMSVSLE